MKNKIILSFAVVTAFLLSSLSAYSDNWGCPDSTAGCTSWTPQHSTIDKDA